MSYILLKNYYNKNENYIEKKKKKRGRIYLKYKSFVITKRFKFLKLLLGKLNKKGKKNLSYFFLINTLLLIKHNAKKKPILKLETYISFIKPSILLFNKKRGTKVYELPRFLKMEQRVIKGID